MPSNLNRSALANLSHYSSAAVPQVSVIIPTYNCDRYIVQAIESVLNQTGTTYEVIVIDDGSTDDTRAVLEPYFDRIHYFYQPNQGVSAARNRGIEQAKGEFVALLDADDFFLPNKLADQIACFAAHPSIGLVHSGWQIVDELGQEIISDQEPWLSLPRLDLEAWLLWRPVFPGAMMFRREWLQDGFDTRLDYAEDAELVLRLAIAGCESIWLKAITVCYRQRSNSATTDVNNTLKQAKGFDAVYEQLFACSGLSRQVQQLEKAARYNYLVWLAWRFHHTGHSDRTVEYLHKALPYTPFSPPETLSNWIRVFHDYSIGSAKELDAFALGVMPFRKGQRKIGLLNNLMALHGAVRCSGG